MSKLTQEIEKISKNQQQDLMQSYKTVNAKLGEYMARGNAIRSELSATKFAPRVRELEQMKETLLGEAKAYYNQAVRSQKGIKTPYVNQYNNLIKFTDEEVDQVNLLKINQQTYNIQLLKDIVASQTIEQLESIFEDLVMDKDDVELFAIMRMYTNLCASKERENSALASQIKAAASLSRINRLIESVVPNTERLYLGDLRSITEREFAELVYSSNPYAYAWD